MRRRRSTLSAALVLALSSLVAPTALAAPAEELAVPEVIVAAETPTTTVSVTFAGNLPRSRSLVSQIQLISTAAPGVPQASNYMPVAGDSDPVTTFRNVPPGDYHLRILPRSQTVNVPSGWVTSQGDWVFDDAGEPPVLEVRGSPLSVGPVVLPDDGNLTGLVVDADGASVRVSDVLLSPVGTSAGRYMSSDRSTDAFTVRGLGPTDYRVRLSFNGERFHLVPGSTGPRFSALAGDPLVTATLGETIDLGPVVVPSIFDDVDVRQQHSAAIMWMRDAGITTGFDDGTFRALDAVRRDAMAAFLYRAAGRPAFTAPDRSPFRDVDPGDTFYKEMAWLAETGISLGWPDGTFRPGQPVNRDAMAAFLYRYVDLTGLYDGTGSDPATYTTPPQLRFKDVAPDNLFYREIAWVASAGIAQGFDWETFAPVVPITRDAMAVFLFRTIEVESRI